MRFQRIAIAAAFAAGLATLPFSQAKAQYYPYPCNPFPLFWPFCAAAAIVGGVGAIVTAPFRGAFYPYYPRYYYGTPAVTTRRPAPTTRLAGPTRPRPIPSRPLSRREPSSRHRRPRRRLPHAEPRSPEIVASSRWRRWPRDRYNRTVRRSTVPQGGADADPQSLHRCPGPV